MMAAPPLLAGAVKLTVAWASPAVAVPMVGDAGATVITVKVWLTEGAGRKLALPAWAASIVQEPAVRNVNAPPLVIVQTLVVVALNVTVSEEVATAVSVGVVPKFCVPGLPKVMVCKPLGVTELEATDALPGPAALVAVTEKV